jgi:hypothetical protein
MQWLFLAGGAPMFVIVVFGLVAIAAAGRFAWAPGPGRFGHIAALCTSVAFASIAGSAVDLIVVANNVPQHPEWWADQPGGLGAIVLVGIGEALSPVVLGFSMISIAALITAVGLRRAV